MSRHKCFVYSGDPSTQLAVVVPFLADGLRENWRCLYLNSPDMIRSVEGRLAERGIDVAGETARGALVLSSDRRYLENGFDPQRMVALLGRWVDDAVAAGFQGLRALGDMRWELDRDEHFEALLEYEARLEKLFHEKPLSGICLYPADAVPAHALQDALVCHPSLELGDGQSAENAFYLPPGETLARRPDRGALSEWMGRQLARMGVPAQERDDDVGSTRREAGDAGPSQEEPGAFSPPAGRGPDRKDAPADGTADGAAWLRRLRRSTSQMNDLIAGMLALAASSNAQLASQPVHLSSMAVARLNQLRRQYPERDVEFSVEPGLRAWGDPALVRAVLDNLLENAWKFTATRRRAVIDVARVAERDDEVEFRVSDNGVGFDAASAGRLFGLFQRLHRQHEFPGTGVGLATVQRIVLRHGGRVWAHGEVGRGAAFYFSLPRLRLSVPGGPTQLAS